MSLPPLVIAAALPRGLRLRAVAGAAGEGADGLSPHQLRGVVLAILAAHVAAGYALVQISAVPKALKETSPIFASLLDPPAPAPPEPLPPAAPPPLPSKPLPKMPPPAIVAARSEAAPEPAAVVAPAPPPAKESLSPIAPPAPPASVGAAPSPAAPPAPPTPAPPAAPKLIPASAVQFLAPLNAVYPRTSIRLGEAGVVVVRVFIDEAGVPHQTEVAKSSGHLRLDDSAVAGVQQARFKPPTDNGQPTSGWARVEVPFELER